MMNSKILVVDDDPVIREICKANLQSVGYDVKTAENGEEGMNEVLGFVPDLVVLDRMMPKLAGEKMLDKVRRHELTKNLPVIFLTAKGSLQDVLEGLRLGANDYLIKPFSINDLIERVSVVLERYKLINSSEDDWQKRSGTTYIKQEIRFQNPADIPGVLYAVSRDIYTPRIKGLKLGIYETLTNAVYHGNLEIDSSIKEADDGFAKYDDLAEKRMGEEEYLKRWVRVVYEQTEKRIKVSITDDGNGFDWRNLPNHEDEDALLSFSGRGILLTRFYYQNVEWNEKGNEVTLIYDLEQSENGKAVA